jgi:hypothetical protein
MGPPRTCRVVRPGCGWRPGRIKQHELTAEDWKSMIKPSCAGTTTCPTSSEVFSSRTHFRISAMVYRAIPSRVPSRPRLGKACLPRRSMSCGAYSTLLLPICFCVGSGNSSCATPGTYLSQGRASFSFRLCSLMYSDGSTAGCSSTLRESPFSFLLRRWRTIPRMRAWDHRCGSTQLVAAIQ